MSRTTEVITCPQPAPVDGRMVFHLEQVLKQRGSERGFILKAPNLSIRQGEKVALVGYSGCGKSTLLDLMAMVLRPDRAGHFAFSGQSNDHVDVLATWQRGDLNLLANQRMRHMGYVLQTGGLLPFLTVRENIGISRQGLGLPDDGAVEKIAGRLGIARHLDKLPAVLSVGERQRVAIARAMAHAPAVVLADEPTASLDPIHANEIMNLFTEMVAATGVTLVVATHDWQRVGDCGFRRIEFDLEHHMDKGQVVATVRG